MTTIASSLALTFMVFVGVAPPSAPTPLNESKPQNLNAHGFTSSTSNRTLLDEIADIVEQKFYSPVRLEQVDWRAAVSRARVAFAKASDNEARMAIIHELLAVLATSHTTLYPRNDPAYWDLASIFEPMLLRLCAREQLPALPVSRDDIGVFWRQIGKDWFVAGVYAGSPAEKAGLKLGDRVVSAGGRPFSPVRSFSGRSGKPVALRIQRTRQGAPLAIEVIPRSTRPNEELRQASAESWRIIQYQDRQVAYLRIWTWTSFEVQLAVLEAIARSNAASVDGFILDLRDGWGGAATHYLSIFFRDVPVLESVERDGTTQTSDYQIRKPTVILVNGGTRSGKETIAYGAKKYGLARLVGERTAGAVVFGQPQCLSDGSILLLAVADAKVDGERLEGHGVAPDVEVPFDIRYAGGQDPQLQRALEVLTGR